MTKNNCEDIYLKFDEKMKGRIGHLYNPVIDNEDEYQRTQLGGAFSIMDDYTNSLVDKMCQMGIINEDCFEEEEDDEKHEVNTRLKQSVYDAIRHFSAEDFAEACHMIMAGMNCAAINYTGLVLQGKMDPIYDESLSTTAKRKYTRNSAKRFTTNVAVNLAEVGALEEGTDGRMHMKDDFTVTESLYKHEKGIKKEDK